MTPTLVSADHDLVTLAQVAMQSGRMVREVEGVIDRLRMAPSWRIGGVPFFDARQVEQIANELRGAK